jgi:quercetin dioxygenase-like cupin family protein
MSQPTIQIGCASNIYIRMMHFHSAGDVEEGHAHQFDHISFLSKGRMQVEVEGIVKEFAAPHMILIAKNKHHRMTSLEDDTIMSCIHALRENADGLVLDPDQIPYDANPRLNNHENF